MHNIDLDNNDIVIDERVKMDDIALLGGYSKLKIQNQEQFLILFLRIMKNKLLHKKKFVEFQFDFLK